MIFLIEYNRGEGKIVSLRDFKDADRRQAEDARLTLDLDLNRRQVDHEVVLFEATNEEDLRRTHRRYFENLREILSSGSGQNGDGTSG